MRSVPYLAAAAFAVLLAVLVRQTFPVTVTVPGIPTIVTDTVTVDRIVVDSFIEYRDRVITDTVTLTHEIVLSDPVLVPCPDLPRIRGITRLAAGHSFGDTTYVSIVDLETTGREIAVQRSVEKVFTPGPLTWLDAGPPTRYDFGEWPDPAPDCNVGCRLLWGLGGMAVGVFAWELAR